MILRMARCKSTPPVRFSWSPYHFLYPSRLFGARCVQNSCPTTPVSERAKDVSTITTNTAIPSPTCRRHGHQHAPRNQVILDTLYMGKRVVEEEDVLIPFRSVDGQKMLVDVMRSGSCENYMSLSEQFLTQSTPPSCGMATLAMVLNSLRVDPGRVWRNPWRWFTEDTLISCFPLEKSEEALGLTMEHFALIAECNGSTAQTYYGSEIALDDFRKIIQSVFTSSPLNEEKRLIVAFDRKVLGQTGTGHDSPIGAYHCESDMLLVMDVARFKYPPYWVPVETMWRAMRTIDPESRRTRGFFVMSRAPLSVQTDVPDTLLLGKPYDNIYTALTDHNNANLKKIIAELVHDVRKELITCACIADACQTLIDCSAYPGGRKLLSKLQNIEDLQHAIARGKVTHPIFPNEDVMTPLDFITQSMPQYVNEIITILIIKHGQHFMDLRTLQHLTDVQL